MRLPERAISRTSISASKSFISQLTSSVFILEMVSMKQNASATWVGGLSHGKGLVTTASGALSQSQYFETGDGEGKGTNPYELIAVAHSACPRVVATHPYLKRPCLVIANETGSLPAAKGEPGTGVRAPVGLILYAEMLSSPRFAT